MGNRKLAGKTSLVTGASRGIGKAVAVALAENGSDVIINYVKEKEKAEALAAELKENGCHCLSVQADVSDEKSVKELFRQIEKEFGTLDILINNAGIAKPQPIHEVTLEDWNEIIRVNLTSAFIVTKTALPFMMKKKFGRVINISSVAAQVGGVVGPHYAASKAGMHGLTRYYASNLAQSGITFNSIAPALIETDMIRNNPRIKPDIIPLKRFGKVDEVADVVVMLACNGYINGQTINVNGGWYMT